MFSILLDPKLIGVVTLVAGCGTTAILLSSNKCITSSAWLQNVSAPVLDCQKDGKHYQVFLTNSGTINKTGEGIKLQIFDVTKRQEKDLRGSGNESQDAKGQRVQVSEGGKSWRIFNLTFPGESPQIQLMSPQKIAGGASPVQITCQKLNLKIKKDRGIQSSLNENIANVKFLVDEKQCTISSGRKECGIKFADIHNLEWDNGFKPKVVLCSDT